MEIEEDLADKFRRRVVAKGLESKVGGVLHLGLASCLDYSFDEVQPTISSFLVLVGVKKWWVSVVNSCFLCMLWWWLCVEVQRCLSHCPLFDGLSSCLIDACALSSLGVMRFFFPTVVRIRISVGVARCLLPLVVT